APGAWPRSPVCCRLLACHFVPVDADDERPLNGNAFPRLRRRPPTGRRISSEREEAVQDADITRLRRPLPIGSMQVPAAVTHTHGTHHRRVIADPLGSSTTESA